MDPKKFVFAKAVEDPDSLVFSRPVEASMDVIGQAAPRDSDTYAAFSKAPDPLVSNKPDPTIYREWGRPREGTYVWKAGTDPATGKNLNISYTRMGNRGIPMLFLHGVPTNKRQWYPVQRLCAPLFDTISIDMLGMGKSSKPPTYGGKDFERWKWRYDVPYIESLMQDLFDGQKFIFVADDWGTSPSLPSPLSFP